MNKIDWTKWSAIAEIVGGIAVVMTLVLLLVGIQENNALIRATMYTDRIESVNDFSLAVAQDADLARMWGAYRDGVAQNLEGIDRLRLINLLQNLLRTYETAWFSHEAGFIGEDEWTRFDGAICFSYAQAQAIGDYDFNNILTDLFVEYLSECPSLEIQ